MTSTAVLDTSRPFTRDAGLLHGLTDGQLRGPRFRRLLHGIHISSDVEVTPVVMGRALLLAVPKGAWISHSSAARIYRVPVDLPSGDHVSVRQADQRRPREGLRCSVDPGGQSTVVAGLPVSNPYQLFVELAGQLDLVDLVACGDHLARRHGLRPDLLVKWCARSRNRSAKRARRAAIHVRERVDSPTETRVRMLIVLAGLPEPEINVTEVDERGVPIRRHDMRYRRSRTVIEYDGRHHIEREQQWSDDLLRREAAEDEVRVIVLTAPDIYRHPGRTLDRIHRILLLRGEPGVPRRLRDQWRAHFRDRG